MIHVFLANEITIHYSGVSNKAYWGFTGRGVVGNINNLGYNWIEFGSTAGQDIFALHLVRMC